ncbi:dimethyl sulfoxide reductase anchor subunit family protein [Minwuia thermotolerans]|uniref:DMSO reductase n=1 Tax=Minwuia thermotolerans TaxID=2056226 RepID=A0A2M9G5H0_9PROT|nr:DmsC/YnfH family molybdoenzyme membrane anchor subunit [Minwuia thermotolerans]PJK30967.1 DMSO reductase [Minwuia thermotolerans]
MYPAFSIIVFTVLSGAGFGAMAAATLLVSYLGVLGFDITMILGFVLAGIGLGGSVLHLQSPWRARYSLSQWRTSWLSREGVFALATMVLAFIVIVGHLLQPIQAHEGFGAWRISGIIAALLCFATVRATGMIYQSLKAVPAWSSQPTSLMFLIFAATSGGLIALSAAGPSSNMAYGVALFFLFVAWYFKAVIWARVDRLEPTATVGSATGLGDHDDVRLFERPHVTENWLTSEMGFRVARRHAMKLRILAVAVGGVLPGAIIGGVLAGLPHPAVWLAALLTIGGLMVERWLFFAEAKHAMTLYYGEQSV